MNTLYETIIDKFYPGESKLRDILLVHSRGVADLAVKVVETHPELEADSTFVEVAAMIHDIGICRCDAEGIECRGTEPYICHGTIGARMLRDEIAPLGICEAELLERLARVCERHTGTGLTCEQIVSQGLSLPHVDLVPETVEEQIVCYADKFFSKTRPEQQKTYEQAVRSLAKFGEPGLKVFADWHERFRV